MPLRYSPEKGSSRPSSGTRGEEEGDATQPPRERGPGRYGGSRARQEEGMKNGEVTAEEQKEET